MHHEMMTSTPTGIWEYVIVAFAIVVFLVSLYLCIKFFLRPGEEENTHIKKKILDDDDPKAGDGS